MSGYDYVEIKKNKENGDEREHYDPNNYVKGEGNVEYSKCEYFTCGLRCQKAGTMSHDTRGKGRWYCKEHFYIT